MKLLFVCSGNIMRSTMAESIAKKFGHEAKSAGVNPIYCKPISAVVEMLADYPEPTESKALTRAMLEWADRVYVMDELIAQNLRIVYKWNDFENMRIADPYHTTSLGEVFDRLYELIKDIPRKPKKIFVKNVNGVYELAGEHEAHGYIIGSENPEGYESTEEILSFLLNTTSVHHNTDKVPSWRYLMNRDYGYDAFNVRENRKHIFWFLYYLKNRLSGEILEVGPMRKDAPFPQYYVDTKRQWPTIHQLDLEEGFDLVGDFFEDTWHHWLLGDVAMGGYDNILMLSVIEHMPNVWDVPKRAAQLLNKDGLLCLQTPFNLRYHAPHPDCWRFSDEGLKSLFGELFILEWMDQQPTPTRENMPLSIASIWRKR